MTLFRFCLLEMVVLAAIWFYSGNIIVTLFIMSVPILITGVFITDYYEKKEERKKAKEEQDRITHRDADTQHVPYRYQIGRHGNEMLALRYGIANLGAGRRGEGNSIMVRKLRRGGIRNEAGMERDEPSVYLVELTDFRNRHALAVIERGTEYIKTFLPLHERWFIENQSLEEVVKGNRSLALKQIVHYHITKTVRTNARNGDRSHTRKRR